ncbi:MAG: hypothetical protein HFJ48_06360 [Clostridia bacterium]|nr:hypothetical protein [Clostridia bacterium]
MKYSELTGICKRVLQNNECLGCQRLEIPDFTGTDKCEYIEEPREKIKRILGIQEKIKNL